MDQYVKTETPQIEEVETVIISQEEQMHIQENYDPENIQYVQLEDGQYIQIIQNTKHELFMVENEQYTIEEYQGVEFAENSQETLYIEVDEQEEEEEEVYTLQEYEEEVVVGEEDVEDSNLQQSNEARQLLQAEQFKSEDHFEIHEEEIVENSSNEVDIMYECELCNETFSSLPDMLSHKSEEHSATTDPLDFILCCCCGEPADSAHTVGDFDCELCEELFTSQRALIRHRSIKHPVNGRFVCFDCKKTFKEKKELVRHVLVHSLQSVKCEECQRDFSHQAHLVRHKLQTGCGGGITKPVYDCRVCGRGFTRKENLGEHLKIHAGILNKRKKHICGVCTKEFQGASLLQIHMRTHTGEKPFPCELCEKSFCSSNRLKKHQRKHTGEKPYKCIQCDATFAAKETLNRHWKTHTGEKPHKCEFCGKAFIQATQLRAHIFHHTGENAYKCPHCGRAFNRKLRLTTHIKFIHEGATRLPCPEKSCKKTFFRKEDIQRHMLCHTGEKPFECDICGKAFSIKSSLKAHSNIHRNEQPVRCEVCSRRFIRKDCLLRHMRTWHRDVVEDIVANAEKKILVKQITKVIKTADIKKEAIKGSRVWNELTLTESIKELLGLLLKEDCLMDLGFPDAPIDKLLESVIRKCGYEPAQDKDFDYLGKLRENAKLLFTSIIEAPAVTELLKDKSVDEFILHVLKLARNQTGEGVSLIQQIQGEIALEEQAGEEEDPVTLIVDEKGNTVTYVVDDDEVEL